MDTNKVERVVQLLIDDYERQDGFLSKGQIERLQDKRGLTIDECVEVYRLLDERGIRLDGASTDMTGPKDTSTESNDTSTESNRPKFYPSGAIDGLGVFMRRSKTKLLTAKEEVELGRRMELGRRAHEIPADKLTPAHREILRVADEARETMIKANIRLVFRYAQFYQGHSDLTLEDLLQEGIFGLMRAVEKFDHTQGYKFSTYAVWWIQQAITRAIADRGSIVRLPAHVHEKMIRLRKAQRLLSQINTDRPPSPRDLANELAIELDQVHFLLQLRSLMPASLDDPFGDEDGITLGDTIVSPYESPEEHVEREGLVDDINKALSSLNSRDREVLEMRFGLNGSGGGSGLTLEQIGQKFGVTRERIRQIEVRALRKMRHPNRTKWLRGYIE